MRQILITLLCCSTLVCTHAYALDAMPSPVDDGVKPDDAPVEHKAKKHSKSKPLDEVSDVKVDGDDGKKPDASADSKMPGDLTLAGDSRIKWLLYDETDVYTITTRYGYQTNIVFSPQEDIELISVGDRSLWQIIPSGNRLFIRPMEEDVITNMTVLTNKHSYQFDLKSLQADKSGNIYVAQFVYPKAHKPGALVGGPAPSSMAASATSDAAPATGVSSSPFGVGPSVPTQTQVAQTQVAQPAAVVTPPPEAIAAQPEPVSTQPVPLAPQSEPAAAVSPAPMADGSAKGNFRYTYSGPDELAPIQVYDDGQFTYLKYRDASKISPSVFMVDSTGKQNPVSYTVKGDYLVVEAVAGELALKSNDSVVHVYNEVLNPG